MLKKIRLDQTKTYEVAIATAEITQMLAGFIDGRKHHKSLGSEQGDINKWDDFVIEESDGTYKHLQVKRQTTPFSTDSCERDNYDRGPRAGKPRDLSTLDESIKTLADWAKKNDPATATPPRKFVIELPDSAIEIKTDYAVRDFNNLCGTYINSTTTAVDMLALEAKDTAVKRARKWLTSWCGFTDWNDILKILKHLETRQTGDEEDINQRTDEWLAKYFANVADVRRTIESLVNHSSTFPNRVTARPVFEAVQQHLLSSIPRWTQYSRDKTEWDVSGIHDAKSVEDVRIVVDMLWGKKQQSYLKFDGDHTDQHNDLSKAMLRLALHFHNLSILHVPNKDLWLHFTKMKVGGTLGIHEADCDDLNFLEYDPCTVAEARRIDCLSKEKEEAEKLHFAMDEITWREMNNKVNQLIREMAAGDLQTAAEIRWKIWHNQLISQPPQQMQFMHGMMTLTAEGSDISSTARVGNKTCGLLANAVFYLILISIGFDRDNNAYDLLENLSLGATALSHWSGPHGQPRKVRSIIDDGMRDILGNLSHKYILFAGTEAGLSEMLNISMAEEPGETLTMATPHHPNLIFSKSIELKSVLKNGTIEGLQALIKQKLDARKLLIDKSINEI